MDYKNKCLMCDKPLVSVGRLRKNGIRSHGDWNNREYHKKCYKLKINNDHIKYLLKI